jgi:hypothetical protein
MNRVLPLQKDALKELQLFQGWNRFSNLWSEVFDLLRTMNLALWTMKIGVVMSVSAKTS